MSTITQHLYLANWQDGFVNYIGSLLGVVAGLMASVELTEDLLYLNTR